MAVTETLTLNVNFNKPFQITITIDPDSLNGVDFNSLKICFFDTSKAIRVAIPTTAYSATYTLVERSTI
jgi:hypothetical protein